MSNPRKSCLLSSQCGKSLIKWQCALQDGDSEPRDSSLSERQSSSQPFREGVLVGRGRSWDVGILQDDRVVGTLGTFRDY